MRRLLIGKITSKRYFTTPADANFQPHMYSSKSNSSSNAEQSELVSDRTLVRQAYQALPLTNFYPWPHHLYGRKPKRTYRRSLFPSNLYFQEQTCMKQLTNKRNLRAPSIGVHQQNYGIIFHN